MTLVRLHLTIGLSFVRYQASQLFPIFLNFFFNCKGLKSNFSQIWKFYAHLNMPHIYKTYFYTYNILLLLCYGLNNEDNDHYLVDF